MFLIVRTQDQIKNTERFFTQNKIEHKSFAISSTQLNKIKIEEGIDGFIVTSANAVLSIPQTKLPFFCVGESTEKECIETGRRVVYSGKQGALEMAEDIAHQFPPMHLIHAAGDTANTNWYKVLSDKDIQVTNKIAYETIYKNSLDTEIKENILNFKAILFFSAMGAEKFTNLLSLHNIDKSQLTVITFSDSIANYCKGYKKIYVSEKPSFDAVKNIITSM